MFKKLMFVSGLCLVLGMGATTANAVTIDLSSPQDGGVVQPGDTVSLTVTVTNDTAKKDNILVTLTATAEGVSITAVGKFRLRLDAGEVWTQTISGTIPADLVVPGPIVVTIEGVAVGRKSKTTDSDSVSATLMP